mmetsp:Transcript_6341/g.9494  ORF Transcript_6341/g.9494 Transcript_6341/m.9494 type:complete len:178 (+) Transcript_6341:26-559(+)
MQNLSENEPKKGINEVDSKISKLLETRGSNALSVPDEFSRNGSSKKIKNDENEAWAFAWMPPLEEFIEESRSSSFPYNKILLRDKIFHNPYALEQMCEVYGIGDAMASYANKFSLDGESGQFLSKIQAESSFHEALRGSQERRWADLKVEKGVSKKLTVHLTFHGSVRDCEIGYYFD